MPSRSSLIIKTQVANAVRTALTNGAYYFYGGASQPASGSDPATGTLIGIATKDGAAWVAGSPANGITLAAPVVSGNNVKLSKPAGESWRFLAIAAGTISYARYVGNPIDDNSVSTALARWDGSVSLPSGDGNIKVSKLTYAIGDQGDIQSCNIWFGDALEPVVPFV